MRPRLKAAEAHETRLAFPYHENYVKLIRMELSALLSVKPKSCKSCNFAIIGSGPLPLTSLCIYDYFNEGQNCITCHNIDQNQIDISLSKDLCRALKVTMGFECANANDAGMDLSCFDVIYLAACKRPFGTVSFSVRAV